MLRSTIVVASIACLAFGLAADAQSQSQGMTFFVTSTGSGKGADFGGLEGADKHCQALAAAVGAGNRTWHAYLSTQGPQAVNAKDRIGTGPWQNAKVVVIADCRSCRQPVGLRRLTCSLSIAQSIC